MTHFFGRLKISLSILHKLQSNRILFHKLRTNAVYLSQKISTDQKSKHDKESADVIFEKAVGPTNKTLKQKNRDTAYYLSGFVLLISGFTYMSAVLYRMYCQVMSFYSSLMVK